VRGEQTVRLPLDDRITLAHALFQSEGWVEGGGFLNLGTGKDVFARIVENDGTLRPIWIRKYMIYFTRMATALALRPFYLSIKENISSVASPSR